MGNRGYAGSYTSPASSNTSTSSNKSWDINNLSGSQTHRTKCWWCGEQVYFHRNDNGGCVLLEELGPPWPVHPCWEIYRHDRTQALRSIESDLLSVGFNGTFCVTKGETQKSPINGQVEVHIQGYVSNNHIWYEKPKYEFFRAGRTVTSANFIRVEVIDSRQKVYPFLLSVENARKIEDYDFVYVKGKWVKRARKWILFSTEIIVQSALKEEVTEYLELHIPETLTCNLCKQHINEKILWGIDPDRKIECKTCGSARGKRSSTEFIKYCRSIIRSNTKSKNK